jgi:hypothetical protein
MAASAFLAELDVEDELLGSSAAGFVNKVEVATYFTVTLEQDGTQDELAAAIAGVSSDEDSVDEAKEDADSVGTPGTTFTLTKDVDDITGSAGDDTITAEPGVNATTGAATTTINSGDAIDGAGGEDTLNITATGSNNNSLSGLTVSGVEVVNITNANNLGSNTATITATAEAAADAEDALASAQAATALAQVNYDAALYVDNASEAGAAGEDSEDIVTYLSAASSVGELDALNKAAAFLVDYIAVEAGTDDVDDIDAVLAFTDLAEAGVVSGTDGDDVTAFSLAQLQAVATASLTNQDGTTNTAATEPSARLVEITANYTTAYQVALASMVTGDGTVQGEAYEAVEALATDSYAAVALAAATESIADAEATDAAYTYLTGNNFEGAGANSVADLESAIEATESPSTDFTLAEYQAAATAALTNDAGEDITEDTAAVEGVTETSTVTFTALDPFEFITIGGVTMATTVPLTAAEVASQFVNLDAEDALEDEGDEVATIVGVTGSGTFTGFAAEAGATADEVVFTSVTADTDVTDLTLTQSAGSEATIETVDGNAEEAAVEGDALVTARLAELDTASGVVVGAGVVAAIVAGDFSFTDLHAAIDASSSDPLTGEDLETSAAGILAAATALQDAYEAAGAAYTAVATEGVGDVDFDDISSAATAALTSAAGTSLVDATNNTAAIDARTDALATAADAVLESATEASDEAATEDALAANAAAVAGDTVTNASISASQFGGSEQIWLKGASTAVDVTGATTQTIGLSGLSGMANSIAFGSASGSVYLAGSTGDLTVTGAKALSISGTTGTVDLTASSSTSVAIDMTGANTLDLSAATALTSVTVSGEGASTLTLGTKVKTITSTDGAVGATISTATVVDNEATTTDETVSAAVTTADAADTITVSTTGTGTTSVSTGGGDDVVVMTRALNSRDSIDGGDDADTIAFIGSAWTAQDYVVLDAAVSGFEVGAFYAAPVTADVSQLGFPVIAAQAGGTFTEASGAAITTWAATSVASTDFDDSDADDIVYGGDLNVTMTGGTPLGATTGIAGGGALTLEGSAATVTVAATSTGDINTTIDGNVETLTVATANSASSTTDRLSTVTITVTATENEALSSVVLSGSGTVTIDSSGAGADDIVLDTIDASALGGTLTKGTTTAGNITGGLNVTTNVNIAETVMLGSGTDTVVANSTYEDMDTISGADFVKETDNAKSTTDSIEIGGEVLTGLAEDQIAEVELTAGATTLGLAFVEAAAATGSDTVFFHFGGDTYVYNDGGNDTLDDGDAALKIVGTIDLSTDWGVYDAG